LPDSYRFASSLADYLPREAIWSPYAQKGPASPPKKCPHAGRYFGNSLHNDYNYWDRPDRGLLWQIYRWNSGSVGAGPLSPVPGKPTHAFLRIAGFSHAYTGGYWWFVGLQYIWKGSSPEPYRGPWSKIAVDPGRQPSSEHD